MLRKWLLSLTFCTALVTLSFAKSESSYEGTWKLCLMSMPIQEQIFALIKVEKKDNELVATILDTPQKGALEITSIKAEEDKVVLTFKIGGETVTFEGKRNAQDGQILGNFGNEKRVSLAQLATTNDTTIGKAIFQVLPTSEEYKAYQKLQNAPALLRFQLSQAKEPEKKTELKAKLEEATKEAKEKMPEAAKLVLEKQPKSNGAYMVAMNMIATAGANKSTKEDVEKWMKVVLDYSAPYGVRFQNELTLQLGETLLRQKGYETLALQNVEKMAKLLKEGDSASKQVRVLKALKTAQEKTGQVDAAKTTQAKLVKLDAELDKEYLATVPPFKPEPYTRKTEGANRVAVMELFTGAQCPPCVAADVAFDALNKAYKPTDLILIQYHMHIPGPDPMTNPDAITRWNYYQQKFPQGIRGTPSTLFNGTPQAGGGGGMANAEKKYADYTGIINPLLEGKTDIAIDGKLETKGEKIGITVEVKGLKEPSEALKVKLLLVEEDVKYVGSNGLRFHHQVVRALPGGAAGMSLKDKTKHTVEVDLNKVRADLKKYLEEYEKNEREFPNSDRPLDLIHLKVIALIQDDESREILQAAQWDVKH